MKQVQPKCVAVLQWWQLRAAGCSIVTEWYTSAAIDGTRTWRCVALSPPTVTAVPAGSMAGCGCDLKSVRPTGRYLLCDCCQPYCARIRCSGSRSSRGRRRCGRNRSRRRRWGRNRCRQSRSGRNCCDDSCKDSKEGKSERERKRGFAADGSVPTAAPSCRVPRWRGRPTGRRLAGAGDSNSL
ncbi:hypothetical protein DFJ73DRAFT_808607 [Zopfochytrium polystomum]|nr:hypothetical protein DFJ73DRAFT_808607 [Zopfochytrium polystomum]